MTLQSPISWAVENGSMSLGGQQKWHKDTLKTHWKARSTWSNTWEVAAADRSGWLGLRVKPLKLAAEKKTKRSRSEESRLWQNHEATSFQCADGSLYPSSVCIHTRKHTETNGLSHAGYDGRLLRQSKAILKASIINQGHSELVLCFLTIWKCTIKAPVQP